MIMRSLYEQTFEFKLFSFISYMERYKSIFAQHVEIWKFLSEVIIVIWTHLRDYVENFDVLHGVHDEIFRSVFDYYQSFSQSV